MIFSSALTRALLAAGLAPTALCLVRPRQNLTETETELDGSLLGRPGPGGGGLDWSDVAKLQTKTVNGKRYGCKCYPGDSCWPAPNKWNQLNNTVGGALSVHIPPGAACHNTFNGLLGTVNTYDAAGCADATANWANESWT